MSCRKSAVTRPSWSASRQALSLRTCDLLLVPLRPDLDATGHCLRLLRDRDSQHAILSGRIDFVAVHRVRQYTAPIELALTPFGASILWLTFTVRRTLR